MFESMPMTYAEYLAPWNAQPWLNDQARHATAAPFYPSLVGDVVNYPGDGSELDKAGSITVDRPRAPGPPSPVQWTTVPGAWTTVPATPVTTVKTTRTVVVKCADLNAQGPRFGGAFCVPCPRSLGQRTRSRDSRVGTRQGCPRPAGFPVRRSPGAAGRGSLRDWYTHFEDPEGGAWHDFARRHEGADPSSDAVRPLAAAPNTDLHRSTIQGSHHSGYGWRVSGWSVGADSYSPGCTGGVLVHPRGVQRGPGGGYRWGRSLMGSGKSSRSERDGRAGSGSSTTACTPTCWRSCGTCAPSGASC